jgi:hypothetical protein
VQRATAQSKTGIFRDYGVAESPPGFQAGWSDCMYFIQRENNKDYSITLKDQTDQISH